MNARRPEPGSAWERHCAEAFPREWLDGSGTLPDGFTRPASPLEADLICARLSEAAFVSKMGKAVPSLSPSKANSKRKPSPVVVKIEGWNRFLDDLPKREPQLSPLAVAIWCWLWRCEQNGEAKTSERMLAMRFDVGRTTIRSKLRELENAGFLELKHRGMRDHSATIYWVRPAPNEQGLKSTHYRV